MSVHHLTVSIEDTEYDVMHVMGTLAGELRVSTGCRFAAVRMSTKKFAEVVNIGEENSTALVQFIFSRRTRWVSYREITRMGFCDVGVEHGKDVNVQEDSYQILAIAWDEVKQTYVGCDKDVKDMKMFWPVLLWSLEIENAIAEEEGVMIVGTGGRRVLVNDDEERPTVVMESTAEDKWEKLSELDTACQERPGKIIRINFPGARGSFDVESSDQLHQPTFAYSPHGACVQLSIVNAVHAITGKAAEAIILARSQPKVIPSIESAQDWLQSTLGFIHLERRPAPLPFDIGEWLDVVRNSRRVYILRLIGRDESENTIDHCLCVDGINNCIWDSAIQKTLQMNDRVLSGSVSTLDEVRDCREVVVQPRGRRSRKSRTNRRARSAKRKLDYDQRIKEEEDRTRAGRKVRKVTELDEDEE